MFFNAFLWFCLETLYGGLNLQIYSDYFMQRDRDTVAATCSSSPQESTLILVFARSNSWTSVESIGCRSCTTCAPQSAPLRAAPTRRATPSQRMRAACPLTACRGCFWDSATWRCLQTLWPSWVFSVRHCSTFIEMNSASRRPQTSAQAHILTHKHFTLWLCVTHNMWHSGPSNLDCEIMFLEEFISFFHHTTSRKPHVSHVAMQIHRLSGKTSSKFWSHGQQ